VPRFLAQGSGPIVKYCIGGGSLAPEISLGVYGRHKGLLWLGALSQSLQKRDSAQRGVLRAGGCCRLQPAPRSWERSRARSLKHAPRRHGSRCETGRRAAFGRASTQARSQSRSPPCPMWGQWEAFLGWRAIGDGLPKLRPGACPRHATAFAQMQDRFGLNGTLPNTDPVANRKP